MSNIGDIVTMDGKSMLPVSVNHISYQFVCVCTLYRLLYIMKCPACPPWLGHIHSQQVLCSADYNGAFHNPGI